MVSTCDGVVRLPWKEVVYPKFIHDPSEELGLMSNHEGYISSQLSSEGGSSIGGLGGSSSGELDSWSWDEEEEALPPDGLDSEPALPRRRRSEDGLGRTSRNLQQDGDYVELLEPRGGPDGGVDQRQRYLEMHGICKTKTLPLCKRGKAIKFRKGKVSGYGRMDGFGSFRGILGTKRDLVTLKDDITPPQRPPGVTVPSRASRSYSSSVHDSDEGDKINRNFEDSQRLYFDGPFKERRPGVGRDRDSNGLMRPCEDPESSNNLVTNECLDVSVEDFGHVVEGHSDHGSHSDSVFEDTDKPCSGESDATTPTSDTTETPFTGVLAVGDGAKRGSKMNLSDPNVGNEGKNKECPKVKEVKTSGFRVPRYNSQAL